MVVRRDLAVVHSTPEAHRLGLVRGRDLVHGELRALARAAQLPRDAGHQESAVDPRPAPSRLSLARGPVGDGVMHVDARAVPVDGEHVLVDVDDRSEAVQVDQVRRDFVANVSHELKTPVGALALLAETIGDAADDPVAIRSFAERIRLESVRLSTLVQEIIELSRVQAVRGVETAERVEVDAVVRDAVEQASWGARGKHIEVAVGGERGAVVYGDRDRLVRAVRNLLDNAIAYSPEGTAVGLGVRRRGGLVEIGVTDRGFGIPVNEQDRVFERFYRIDPARSRETGGTGLGLAIVKHVVENHGGDVQLWSRPGHGSTFTLRLPDPTVTEIDVGAAEAAEATEAADTAEAAEAAEPVSGRTA